MLWKVSSINTTHKTIPYNAEPKTGHVFVFVERVTRLHAPYSSSAEFHSTPLEPPYRLVRYPLAPPLGVHHRFDRLSKSSRDPEVTQRPARNAWVLTHDPNERYCRCELTGGFKCPGINLRHRISVNRTYSPIRSFPSTENGAPMPVAGYLLSAHPDPRCTFPLTRERRHVSIEGNDHTRH